MEKTNFKKVKYLILGFIIVLGAILGALTLIGNNETLRKIFAGLLIALIAFFGATGLMDSETSPSTAPALELDSVMVTKIIDGDTIEINYETRVRLLGVDAPEKEKCYYQEAKDALEDLVLEKEVKLEKDISETDKFNRLLRYVFLASSDRLSNDLFVNEYLAQQGYVRALSVEPDHKYRALLVAAQGQARINQQGIWTECLEQMSEEELKQMGDPPPDPNCIIKGNISIKGRIYFMPDSALYEQVKINLGRGEKYFCTEGEAQDAGFRKSASHP